MSTPIQPSGGAELSTPVIVLKFGGSVLLSEADLIETSREVRAWVDRGFAVVAVVSAFEGTTDTLLAQAKRCASADGTSGEPDPAARALLLATGELASAALLGVELKRAALTAEVCPPWRLRVSAIGAPLDAFPTGFDAELAHQLLRSVEVLVIPGFIGLDEQNQLVLLGRGGSDLSAIFVARQLHARCRLVKDVDGLYEYDPAGSAVRSGQRPPPRRYASLHWNDALRLGGGIVQSKAVTFALENHFEFEVSARGQADASIVGNVPAEFASSPRQADALATLNSA